MVKPWQKFKVGAISSRPNWTEPTCVPLRSVAHVAHVPTALRILEDRSVHADLVFDESKLKTERIRVVWLSPNDWTGAGGFRYGNIRFTFDWADLVEGKRSYWVESIAYGIPACRILLTNAERPNLDPYDPSEGDGPWWRTSSGEHYWNGERCLEVMFEDDIVFSRITEVDFVQHHPNYCSEDYRSCAYRGVSALKGSAEFIAALASRGLSLDLPGLVQDRSPSETLKGAVSLLRIRCDRVSVPTWGSVEYTDPGARALARAVLASLGNPLIADDLANLATQFKSVGDLETAVAETVAAAAGLSNASSFFEG